jgi:hypothetical protein
MLKGIAVLDRLRCSNAVLERFENSDVPLFDPASQVARNQTFP